MVFEVVSALFEASTLWEWVGSGELLGGIILIVKVRIEGLQVSSHLSRVRCSRK